MKLTTIVNNIVSKVNGLTTAVSNMPAISPDRLQPIKGSGQLAQFFGNAAGWHYAPLGGSRMILGEYNSAMTTAPVKYKNIDCNNEVQFSFDVNVDTLRVGTVFAVYLVPMQPETIQAVASINSTLRDDLNLNPSIRAEWGVGYGDAQGVNNIRTTEIDILEVSAIGLQCTLHGYLRTKNPDGSYTTAIQYETDGVTPKIDKSGIWKSAAGEYATLQMDEGQPLGTFTNVNFGPADTFKINSLKAFNVQCTLRGPLHPSVNTPDMLYMKVTITQGSNTLEAELLSPGFPTVDLARMNLITSIWATEGVVSPADSTVARSSWWLDGYDWSKEPITDKRGWGRMNNTQSQRHPEVPTSIVHAGHKYYHNYATPVMFYIETRNMLGAGSLAPLAPRLANLGITYIKTGTGVVNNTNLPVMILDVMYRGVNSTTTNWHCRYAHSYGVYFNKQENINIDTRTLSRGLIPLVGDSNEAAKASEYFTKTENVASDVAPVASTELAYTFQTDGVVPTDQDKDITHAYTTIPGNYIFTTGFTVVEVI